ncbi:hypothetical protein [Pseudomonas poae]|uniref:hypothetical protein n=1 Tax=Pseudomonas poae TaxID=200451 RepID=UPI0030D1340D
MHLKRHFAWFCISMSSTSWASATPSVSGTELLAAAKLSGACGIVGQMASFQDSTKMAGGTEFLNRFMIAEAARLGWTLDQYLEHCRGAIQLYQTYYDELDKSETAH